MVKTKGIGDDRALVKLGGVGDDDRTEQDDIGYEKVPIASPYLPPDEVVPHFKAPFLLNALVTLQRINDCYCSDPVPLGTCETVVFVEGERSALTSGNSA